MRFVRPRHLSETMSRPVNRHFSRAGGRSRALASVTATAAAMLLAAGCQGSGSEAGGGAHVNASLTVAVVPGVDTVPLYIAMRDGDFSDLGLHVKIDQVASASAALTALNSGQADVAAGDYVNFFYAQGTARKPDLRIVADAYDCAPGVMQVLAMPNSGITKAQDLAGKSIGTPPSQGAAVAGGKPYNLETLLTQSVMQTEMVTTGGINWVPMPTGSLVPALSNGTVNAIVVQEPYIFQAESKLGAVPVLDACTGGTTSLPLDGYFTTSAFGAKNTAALDAFRSVLQEERGTVTDQMTIRQELAKLPGITPQAADLVTVGSYPTTLSASSLQRVADMMTLASNPMLTGASNGLATVQTLIVP